MLACLACDPAPADSSEASGDGSSKADDPTALSSIVATPGALRWDLVAPLATEVTGDPIFVSNNPEHIHGFGILAGVPFPGLSLATAQRHGGAPQAQWLLCDPAQKGSCERRDDRQIQDQCPDGGLNSFDAYIAHILPRDLGSSRHLSFVAQATSDVTLTVVGDLGTTDWSRNGRSLTLDTDWLGARIARTFFFGEPTRRTIEAKAGELVTLASSSAESLVEGRFHVEVDGGCVFPFTVAHAQPSISELPSNYAAGDVKWPGWFNGQGEGRAAGIFAGSGLSGTQTIEIQQAPAVQGVGALSKPESMRALAKHGDSADILFGNYGALYDQRFDIANATGHCIEVDVDFVSYIDRNGTPTRTPTHAFFTATDGAYTPSMMYNSPIRVSHGGSTQLVHASLSYGPTAEEIADPTRALASLRQPLGTVRIEEGDSEPFGVELPVPGYIVAPVAFTFSSRPCPGVDPGSVEPAEDPEAPEMPLAGPACHIPDESVRTAHCDLEAIERQLDSIATCTETGGSTACADLAPELQEASGCDADDRMFCFDAGAGQVVCEPAGGDLFCYDTRCFTGGPEAMLDVACGTGATPTHSCDLVQLFTCLHDAPDPSACLGDHLTIAEKPCIEL